MRYLEALILVASLSAPAVAGADAFALSLWSTPLGMPGEAKFAAADLDGDGRDEVVGMGSMFSGQSRIGSAVSVQGFDAQGDWRMFQLDFPDELSMHGVIVGRRAGGDIVATAVGHRDPAGVYSTSIDFYEGMPLARTRSITPATNRWPEAIVDIDADGDLDLITQGYVGPSSAYSVRAEELDSSAPVWSYTFDFQRKLSVAQLDGDAALEIAISGVTGTIIDGLDGSVEWSAPTPFGRVVAGNFGMPGPSTFASDHFSGFRFFQGPPYALGISHDFSATPAFAIDIDGEPDDELALVNGYSVLIFDRSDRDGKPSVVRSLRLPEMYTRSATLAELDGDPAPEVLALDGAGGASGASGGERGTVFDPFSGAALADFWGQRFDATPVLVAPFDGTGGEQAALFAMVEGGGSMSGVQLVDLSTGALAARSDVLFRLSGGPPPTFTAAQLDGDPQVEILLGRRSDIGTGFVALDGKTLSPQVFGPAPINPWQARKSRVIEIADIDADGVREVVVVDADEPAVVRVFDAMSGALEWQSPSIERDVLSTQPFQIDADPALELLVWNGNTLHVVDGATHALQADIDFASYGALHPIRDGGACRLAVVTGADIGEAFGSLAMHTCDGMLLGSKPIAGIQDQKQFFLIRSGVGYTFAGGRLQRINLTTGASTPISDAVGPSAGLRRDSVVVRDVSPGVFELVFANDGKVERIEVNVPELFGDGFE